MPGEFEWIERMTASFRRGRTTRVGIGDDAAVLRSPGGAFDLLLTTDMLIEERHFRFRDAKPYWVGRKAMAVNVSDIAAMGGEPVSAVVSVGVSDPAKERKWREICRGMQDAAKAFGFDIVGGDTNASKTDVLSVAMIGRVPKGRAILRSTARSGDAIYVTGKLGGSYPSGRHLCFTPRLKESAWLRDRLRPSAMMDLSDGLAQDIRRLADASGVGALLEEGCIPRHEGVSLAGALGDGEDFELLFTLPPSWDARLRKEWPSSLAPITRIGRIRPRSNGLRILKKDGRSIALPRSGFDHFR